LPSPERPGTPPLIEHATLTLAAQAGIRVAATQAVPLHQGHAVAVKRFDRVDGTRIHALSARVALKAAGEDMGYPELAQLLRRRGPVREGVAKAHMRELFVRQQDLDALAEQIDRPDLLAQRQAWQR
jgi:serine/threonine-protein kinase HipA